MATKQSLIIHTHTRTHFTTHTLAHTHTRILALAFLWQPKHATFIYSTFCQTRAQIIYESPETNGLRLLPFTPCPPTFLLFCYITYYIYTRHICTIVCARAQYVLAPGLRSGHSRESPLLPLLPLRLAAPRAICAL